MVRLLRHFGHHSMRSQERSESYNYLNKQTTLRKYTQIRIHTQVYTWVTLTLHAVKGQIVPQEHEESLRTSRRSWTEEEGDAKKWSGRTHNTPKCRRTPTQCSNVRTTTPNPCSLALAPTNQLHPVAAPTHAQQRDGQQELDAWHCTTSASRPKELLLWRRIHTEGKK